MSGHFHEAPRPGQRFGLRALIGVLLIVPSLVTALFWAGEELAYYIIRIAGPAFKLVEILLKGRTPTVAASATVQATDDPALMSVIVIVDMRWSDRLKQESLWVVGVSVRKSA